MSDIWQGRNNEGDIVVSPMNNGLFRYSYTGKPDESFETGAKELCDFFEPKNPKGGNSKPKHSHYHKNVSQYDTIDIYVICDLYVKDNSGCIQHAVKKLLCCGERGVKDNVKDLQEAIDTIQRKIEMLQGRGEAADD